MMTDCFAYIAPEGCGALKEVICKDGKCPFYKSHRQYSDDLAKYPPIDYKAEKDKKHKKSKEVKMSE